MVTVWMEVGLFAVLLVAVIYQTRRRRSVVEANLPAGISRAARRKVLQEQGAQDRAAQAKFRAEHPYMHGGGGDGGGL